MVDDNFPIVVQKGQQQVSVDRELKKSGPVLSTLVVEDGTPGATVFIDDSPIDQPVDDQGNLTYPSVPLGTHSITLSKPGYGPQTVSVKTFSANGKVFVRHIKLSPQVGHVKFSIKPANAIVHYRRRGEESQIADISKILDLPPGTYQFTAEAEKLDPHTEELEIKPAVTTPFSVTLQPRAPVTEETKAFVDPGLVVRNADWYTGKNTDFVPLVTHHAKNTLLFLKGKAKKMTWKIFLDDANNITYTLDNKGLSSVKVVDGLKASNPKTPLDMSGTDNASNSFVVRIHLLSDGVKIAKHDETVVDKTPDDKHDWRRARIYVKGDTTFTVWLNQ